jgi:hypothetical protein
MSEQTVALILALLPVAEKLIFEVGDRLIELSTADLTREELLAALENSKAGNWPQLEFASTKQD